MKQEIQQIYNEWKEAKTLFEHKSKALESLIVKYVEKNTQDEISSNKKK